jgi:hypothetical protein
LAILLTSCPPTGGERGGSEVAGCVIQMPGSMWRAARGGVAYFLQVGQSEQFNIGLAETPVGDCRRDRVKLCRLIGKIELKKCIGLILKVWSSDQIKAGSMPIASKLPEETKVL